MMDTVPLDTSDRQGFPNRAPALRNQGSNRRRDGNQCDSAVVDESAVNLLSSLDEISYDFALMADAKLVLENYVFPMSFPWHKPKALLIRTIPRDIDDMHGLWFAGEDRALPDSSEKGQLGYGAFDQGVYGYSQLRSDSQESAEVVTESPSKIELCLSPQIVRLGTNKCTDNLDGSGVIIAAVRRSTDPGVMELAARLPLPRSLDSILVKYQSYGVLSNDPWLRNDIRSIDAAKQIIVADRKVSASVFPLSWSGDRGAKQIRHDPFFNHPEKFRSDSKEAIQNREKRFLQEFEYLNNEVLRSKNLVAQSLKHWRISVKVENVSSRSTLFPFIHKPAQVVDERKDIARSLLCVASLPLDVNTSKSTQLAENKVHGRNGIHLVPTKRRTRLIWSTSSLGSSNKLSFSDLLTGQKVDGRCPKDIMVAIRLNGKLLSKGTTIRTGPQQPDISTKARADKHTNVSILESFTARRMHSSQIKATNHAYSEMGKYSSDYDRFKLPIEKRTKPRSLSIISKSSTYVIQDVIPMKHGGSHILKQVDPQISLMTLSDCSGRVFCETTGSMRGSSVHQLLSMTARALGNVCSVCWFGDEASDIVDCVDCGLLVHLECCLDKGNFMKHRDLRDQKVWRCAVCTDSNNVEESKSLHQLSNRKSIRTSKVPSRFLEKTAGNIDQVSDNCELYHKKISKGRPCHKCSMCPHSGGAMSKHGSEGTTIDKSASNQRWTHEICRIWGANRNQCRIPTGSYVNSGSNSTPAGTLMPLSKIYQTYTSDVCALCGMGAIHNLGKENEEIIEYNPVCFGQRNGVSSASSTDLVPGLVRCAAIGCFVTFHPMCAVLSSKLRQDHNYVPKTILSDRIPTQNDQIKSIRKGRDIELTKRFTLTLMSVEQENAMTNQIFTTVVPVAFCGIHNPERAQEFYGTV